MHSRKIQEENKRLKRAAAVEEGEVTFTEFMRHEEVSINQDP